VGPLIRLLRPHNAHAPRTSTSSLTTGIRGVVVDEFKETPASLLIHPQGILILCLPSKKGLSKSYKLPGQLCNLTLWPGSHDTSNKPLLYVPGQRSSLLYQ